MKEFKFYKINGNYKNIINKLNVIINMKFNANFSPHYNNNLK